MDYIYIYVLPVLPVCAYIHIYIYVLLEGVDLWLVSEYGNITLATAPSCASIAFGQVDRTEQLFRLEEADGAAANDERNPRSKKGRKPGQYMKIWGKNIIYAILETLFISIFTSFATDNVRLLAGHTWWFTPVIKWVGSHQ